MFTPQPIAIKLASAIGLNAPLYIKREDLNPFGSHKGRSIPMMIETCAQQGARDFVISSSGNAALAAARYVAAHPELKLTVFVGKNINGAKLSVILSEAKNPLARSLRDSFVSLRTGSSALPQDDNWERITVKQVANPKQAAFQLSKSDKIINLRQSIDDLALVGYEKLARELAEIKNLAAVFVPTSSGTTAQGLYEGFKKLGKNPQIHIVQTEQCHPMVVNETPPYPPLKRGGKNSVSPPFEEVVGGGLASAIVDKVAHRKAQILEVLKNSHGAGWVATDDEISEAMNMVSKTENINISPNSALSVAGLVQAIKSGQTFAGAVVCLLTGP